MKTLETASDDSLTLPKDTRMDMASRQKESVGAAESLEEALAYEEEIKRRIEQIKSGEAETIPAEEVHAELRRIAAGRR